MANNIFVNAEDSGSESFGIFDNHFIGGGESSINTNTNNRRTNNVNVASTHSSANNDVTNDPNTIAPMRQSLTWSRINSRGAIPPARSGAASVVVQGTLYIFGGYGGGTSSRRLDDFYSFNFTTNEWKEVEVLSEEKPGYRENNGVVIGDSDKVYLFGGYNGATWLNDLWVYSIASKRWECLQESSDPNPYPNSQAIDGSTAPSRRFGYVSVVHDNKLVVFAGFDGSRWLQDMYSFDFETKTWAEVHATGELPSARSCPAWAKDETYVYIHGGYDGVQRKSDFFRFNLKTNTWKEMSVKGTPPSARYFHSCCLYSTKLIVYGGYSGSLRLSDMYAYDFDTELWSQIDSSFGCPPKGRSSLVAQVYDNSLYVGFGYDGDTVLNDFYKFRLRAISVPRSSLLNNLSSLINNSQMSDVTFMVEGQEIHANRSILAVRSDYFNALFFGGSMKESIQATEDAAGGVTPENRRPIEMMDVSYPVFMKVLEFLYTDTLQDLPVEIGIPLLITSERFMLDRLKALCEDFVRRDITVENVMNILITSYRHNATDLKEIAFEFILHNLANPLVVDGLTELKVEPDLLIEIIRRKSANHPLSEQWPFGQNTGWGGTSR